MVEAPGNEAYPCLQHTVNIICEIISYSESKAFAFIEEALFLVNVHLKALKPGGFSGKYHRHLMFIIKEVSKPNYNLLKVSKNLLYKHKM